MHTCNNWINWIKFGYINWILEISWIILKMDMMYTVTLHDIIILNYKYI